MALLAVMFVDLHRADLLSLRANRPVGWTEEVIITVLALDGAVGRRLHLSRERRKSASTSSIRNVSERARRVFTVVDRRVLVLLYAISLPATYGYVSFMKVEQSAYLHVPINWLYSIYLIFVVACIVRYVWLVVARHPRRQVAR